MISPSFFYDRITVQTLTRSFDGLGSVDTWTNGNTLWACVCQPTDNRYMQVHVQYKQPFNKTTDLRIIVRGKQDWDYSTTRFIWESPNQGVRILRPTENPRLVGGRHTAYTGCLVEDITELEESSISQDDLNLKTLTTSDVIEGEDP